jgi:phage gp29-like protein
MSEKNLLSDYFNRDLSGGFHKYIEALPNPDKILRKTGKTIEAYRDLKNDPHVWSCIQSRKSGILSLEYQIAQNGASTQITKQIEDMFDELDMQQIMRDILEAPLFGYRPMEIIWEIAGINRKYIVPKEIIAKPQEWFFYNGEGKLRFRKSGESKGIEPPPMKILNVQYEASYMNPYGQALLTRCYWPVTFKNGGLRFWVNFSEKYGMPFLVGQYLRGSTSDEIQRLADELAKMTEDAVIVTPSDIKIEMREAGRTSSISLYKELIRYCNAEISKALLSQTLTTELDMGSYAAAQTHFKVRREVILGDILLVENTMNQIIKYIVNLNFAKSPYPKFYVLINDSDNMLKVDRDVKITQTGSFKFTKKYWMTSYGFKEDEIAMLESD